MDGVGRGSSRWSRAYPNTVRSGYRYGDTRILVYGSLGFRWGVNGVYRGNGVNPSDPVYCGRVTFRSDVVSRRKPNQWIGFRLNGVERRVDRGCRFGGMAMWCNSRFRDYSRVDGNENTGFRLNGVDRGGHYGTASLQNVRSGGARLNNKRLNAVIDYIGFRTVCMV